MLIGIEKPNCCFLSDAEYEILCRDNPDLGSCPTCRERGTYRYRGVEQICNCQEQRQLHTQYLAGGIGLLYQRLDWDHFTGDPEVVKTLQSYVRRHEDYVDQGLGLLFTGERGIGKTMLATLVLGSTISQVSRPHLAARVARRRRILTQTGAGDVGDVGVGPLGPNPASPHPSDHDRLLDDAGSPAHNDGVRLGNGPRVSGIPRIGAHIAGY